MRRRRYRFSRSVLRRVYDEIRAGQDNWHAPLAVIQLYCLIAVSVLVPYVLQPFVDWRLSYFLISLPTLGCWQRACATLLHESSKSHASLAKNSVVNFVCGTLLSGYLVLQSWTAYSLSHLLHHVHLGDDEQDPDLAFQLIWGTYNPQKPWWFAIKYLITPPLWVPPIKLYDLVVNRLFAKPKTLLEFLEQLLSLAYFISICAILIWIGWGWQLLWFWIVPLAYSFPLVNYYNELFEHYPYVGDSDLDVHMTRNRWVGPFLGFFTCMFNENMHQTHHLFPTCPFWVLPKIHEILLEDPEYRKSQTRDVGLLFPTVKGIPSIIGNILLNVGRRRSDRRAA